MTISNDDAATLLDRLVRIESVTPWLIPEGSGEAAIAAWIARWFSDLPVEVARDEIAPGRVNLIARLRGTGDGPTLCINAHADTVGFANWADRALEPRVAGDRMVGIGAADDKAGCAAGMLALRELARGPALGGDVLLACVADEEGVSIGTEDLVDRYEVDGVLIVEPDALPRVIVEHQGFGWVEVVVHGKAAHGSAPEDGIDANVHMADVIRGLDRLDRQEYAATAGSMSGRTVFHTGTLHGGTDFATYPSKAVLGIEIGTQPGEHLSDRIREIEGIFADVAATRPGFKGEVVIALEREPFKARSHEVMLEALSVAIEAETGTPAEPVGLNAWADSGLTQGAGIPTVMFGPLGGNFHAPDEWASISETAAVGRILEATARRFCVTSV